MISGVADCSSRTFNAVVLVRPIYDIVLYDAMPVADSTNIIFQCRNMTGRSVFSAGPAKPDRDDESPGPAPVSQRHRRHLSGQTPRQHDIAGPEQVGRHQQPPRRVPE